MIFATTIVIVLIPVYRISDFAINDAGQLWLECRQFDNYVPREKRHAAPVPKGVKITLDGKPKTHREFWETLRGFNSQCKFWFVYSAKDKTMTVWVK